jgi:hypothetical protein
MNIDNKKTALDDDASIYQGIESQETAKTERQKLSELSFKGKLRYLWDYYAQTAFLVLFFGGIVIAILVTVLRHKPTTVASIIFIDDLWQTETLENYAEDLLKQVRPDASDSIIAVTNGYRSDLTNDGVAISTRVFAREIDLIIGTKSFMENYAKNDNLLPFDSLPDDLRRAIAGRSTITTDESSHEGTHVFALSLTDTAFMQRLDSQNQIPADTYYIGICQTTLPERYDIIYDILRAIIGQ